MLKEETLVVYLNAYSMFNIKITKEHIMIQIFYLYTLHSIV